MTPGLLLIDLQNDYLARRALEPDAPELVARCGRLLDDFRDEGWPVVHCHTLIRADGTNRMPHWKRAGVWACVAGTSGAQAPSAVAPHHDEPVVAKSFYSAFGSGDLDDVLAARSVDVLVMAGLYLHACVSATTLDAYQRGYEVFIARDAVAATDERQRAAATEFLDGRAAQLLDANEIVHKLSRP
ncbi:MAG: cysteine hydrolase [Actinomycetota bacterium]|nr:cysteine hydrolase [Actinomycetota bacterium]